MDEVPPLVAAAQAVARQAGFPLTREEAGPGRASACLPGVGRFLAMLAAGCVGGRIGELGTGAGIGAAWLASAIRVLPAGSPLRTQDIKRQLFSQESRLVATEVVRPDLHHSLLVGTRVS